MTPRDRPVDAEVDALVTDRYLDGLLAVGEQGAGMALTRRDDDAIALREDLGHATAVLRASLLRVHPSFRFEERLARRLAEVADAMRASEAAGAEGARIPVVLPFDPGVDPADPGLGATGSGLPGVPRPLLIGALSLAGAAIVAWRFGWPADPMTRAVRTAHQLAAGRPHGMRID